MSIPHALHLQPTPTLSGGRMIIGMTGWMDGGEVSSGTVELLTDTFETQEMGYIDPEPFFLRSLPNTMEQATAFRPYVNIEDGVISEYDDSETFFKIDVANRLVLFSGGEPNMQWNAFSDCLLDAADETGVRMIYFIGSVAGAVPHTREPRLFTTVTDPAMKPAMEQYGLSLNQYEGPASFVTHLMHRAQKRDIQVATLVAEIPAYIQGTNPKCIEAVVRKLSSMLGLAINTDKLRKTSDKWERKVDAAIKDKTELFEHIQKLEEDYDNELFDAHFGELRDWLEQKGIRLD